jgi:hypothetical protein
VTRALTATRLRVPEAQRAEYLSVLAELEQLGRTRGRHLWVFHNKQDAGLFLEFSEAGGEADLRSMSAATGREAELEARWRALVTVEGPDEAPWVEVPLPPLTS